MKSKTLFLFESNYSTLLSMVYCFKNNIKINRVINIFQENQKGTKSILTYLHKKYNYWCGYQDFFKKVYFAYFKFIRAEKYDIIFTSPHTPSYEFVREYLSQKGLNPKYYFVDDGLAFKQKKYWDRFGDKINLSTKMIVDSPNKFISKNKQDVVNLFNDFPELSKKQKKYINNFFGLSLKKMEKEMDCILLTQPLYEDGLCNLDDKQLLYNLYIDNLLDGKIEAKQLWIKPHPRETQLVRISNKNVNTFYIERNIPIELLFLNGLKVKNIVSFITSTIIYKKFLDCNFINLDLKWEKGINVDEIRTCIKKTNFVL